MAIAIAVGSYHSLALKEDGTVATWGGNSSGQSTVPKALNNVSAIAAGDEHSLALKSDGTVVAWGSNWAGESTVPTGLNNVVAIAAGSDHSLALKSDSTVVTWGNDPWNLRTVPTGLSGVIAIAAGVHHILALVRDSIAPSGPTIVALPQSREALAGVNVTFSVTASGSPPLNYQWRRDGVNLPSPNAFRKFN